MSSSADFDLAAPECMRDVPPLIDVEVPASAPANQNDRARGHLANLLTTDAPTRRWLSTGLPSLDRCLRGGLSLGSLVAISGAPGGGKTTAATCLLDRFERAGCVVFYFAADEPGSGVIVRVAQMAGYSREALEAEGSSRSARAEVAQSMSPRCWHIIDPDVQPDAPVEGYCLEDFLNDAEAEAARVGMPLCIVIDSIQQAPCRAARDYDNPRERVDAAVRACKAASKRGVTVIILSEMSRDAYKRPDHTENAIALASSKESGSIEYQVSVLLAVRPDQQETGKVWLEVAKARGGHGKPTVPCRIDPITASFDECDGVTKATPVTPKRENRSCGHPRRRENKSNTTDVPSYFEGQQ